VDKWLERVLFVNVIMLLAFIYSDYVTWMGLVVDPPIPVSSNSVGPRAFYAVFLAPAIEEEVRRLFQKNA